PRPEGVDSGIVEEILRELDINELVALSYEHLIFAQVEPRPADLEAGAWQIRSPFGAPGDLSGVLTIDADGRR
ncbi:hypothetical protein, partial [Escherichia coli]